MTMLGALESMNDRLVGNVDDDGILMSAVVSNYNTEQKLQRFDDVDKFLSKKIDALERLESIRDAVVKFGLSRSMMEAADPTGELCAAGIIPAYESLSDSPAITDESIAIGDALEGLLGTFFTELIEELKTMGMAFTDFMKSALNGFDSQKELLRESRDKISAIQIDPAKLKQREISALSSSDFVKRVSGCEELISKLGKHNFVKNVDAFKTIMRSSEKRSELWEAAKDQLGDSVGALTTIASGNVTTAVGVTHKNDVIVLGKSKLQPTHTSLAEHRWDKAVCLKAHDHISGAIDESMKIVRYSIDTLASISDVFSYILRYIKDVLTFSPIKAVIRDLTRYFTQYYVVNYERLVRSGVSELGREVAMITSVSNALSKCKV